MHALLKRAFVKDDEVDTRYNFFLLVENESKKVQESDEFEYHAYQRALEKMNNLSFSQIEEICNPQGNNEKSEDVHMAKDENKGLFDSIFNSKDDIDVTVYLNGEDEMVFKKLKSFVFEEKHYVLLKDEKNDTSAYYQYVVREEDGKQKERLFEVEDDLQISLFKYLGL